MKHPLPFPQLLSCCVCLIRFLSGCQNSLLTQPTPIHSICHQSNVTYSTNWNQGVLFSFHRAALYVLACCSSKTVIIPFQSTTLSQNSQTAGCILGMPRKLRLSPEAGAGEDMKFPQYSSWLQLSWQMYIYPPWRVNRVRQPREKILSRDQQSCKQTINTVCNADYKTLSILKQHFSWVMPTYPSMGWRYGIVLQPESS